MLTASKALEYKFQLEKIDPNVHYLMSLFVRFVDHQRFRSLRSLVPLKLHSSVTPDVIDEAAKAGITGVKMYPQGKSARRCLIWSRRLTSLGVTTNSENGVANVEAFYPTFAAMESNDMGKLCLRLWSLPSKPLQDAIND